MFKKISLENFKGFSAVEIELSKLNVFVGENGTGKSSIIQAMSILKRSLGSSGIVTDLPYVNLGSLHEIVPPAKTASICVQATVPLDLKMIDAKRAEFKCAVRFDTQGLSEYETEVWPESTLSPKIHNVWTRYGVARVNPAQWQYYDTTFNFGVSNAIGSGFGLGGYVVPPYLTPDKAATVQRIYTSLQSLSQVIRAGLERVYVVPTTRGLTEPGYPLQREATPDFSPRAGPISMGTVLASNLTYFSQNQEKINRWQKEILDVGVKYFLEPGPSILIRNPDNEVNYVNEGFGSNQMLFVLERIANSPEESLIAIEEPEIHMHPKAQFRFGLLACEIVKEENKQLLLTTHSEHVVSGILTAVRKGKLKPNDISLWFFEKKDFQNTATQSEVDEEGKTKGALQSFLEASVEELSQYVKAPS